MEQVSRVWFTPQQKAELWERWKSGNVSLRLRGRWEGGTRAGFIGFWRSTAGLYRRRAARRPPLALRLDAREEISRGLAAGQSLRQIACGLGRAPSTVSGEIRRHGGRQGYRASWADQRAWDRALRPKACRLAYQAPLRWRVA
jgi:hypothetical protein